MVAVEVIVLTRPYSDLVSRARSSGYMLMCRWKAVSLGGGIGSWRLPSGIENLMLVICHFQDWGWGIMVVAVRWLFSRLGLLNRVVHGVIYHCDGRCTVADSMIWKCLWAVDRMVRVLLLDSDLVGLYKAAWLSTMLFRGHEHITFRKNPSAYLPRVQCGLGIEIWLLYSNAVWRVNVYVQRDEELFPVITLQTWSMLCRYCIAYANEWKLEVRNG